MNTKTPTSTAASTAQAAKLEALTVQNTKNEATGKVFFFTGLALLLINGVIALATGKPVIVTNMLPFCLVFTAVGGGLWLQARRTRQRTSS